MAENTITLTDNNFEEMVASGSVLVDFWASWCGPCIKVGPILNEIAGEHAAILKIGKVNVDENPSLAMKYQVQSIPTMILFQDGTPSPLRIVGAKGKDAILADLRGQGLAV